MGYGALSLPLSSRSKAYPTYLYLYLSLLFSLVGAREVRLQPTNSLVRQLAGEQLASWQLENRCRMDALPELAVLRLPPAERDATRVAAVAAVLGSNSVIEMPFLRSLDSEELQEACRTQLPCTHILEYGVKNLPCSNLTARESAG